MLKAALETLKTLQAQTNLDVGGDFKTRPGREAQRRQARAAIPEAEKKFGEVFRKHAFPIFLDGPATADFIELASQEDEVVSVDFRKATENVRQGVKLALSGRNREFSPSALAVLMRECRQLGADLGLTSIPSPQFDGVVYLKDDEAVDVLVDQYLVKYMGSEFLGQVIDKEAIKSALQLECNAPVIPVLITGLPESVQLEVGGLLFGGRSTSYTTNATVEAKDIGEAFKEIRKHLKKQKQQEKQEQ